MSSDLLLIVSAPLETAEDMFRQVGAPLADSLGSIPDGEPGERRWSPLLGRQHLQLRERRVRRPGANWNGLGA
jgi:hypothetical protein